MKLYHGTSRRALSKILAEGIRPRGKRKGNWTQSVESNPRCVYLTNAYPLYFAINVAKDLSDVAIVEVDSERLRFMNLLPDEDAIEQTNRGQDELPKDWDIIKRTRHYRKRMPYYAGQWPMSINALGTCCYQGTVPTSAITRVAELDLKANMKMRWASDPSISLINYRIMGGFYRQLVRHIFSDEVDPSDYAIEGRLNISDIPRDGITVRNMNVVAPSPIARMIPNAVFSPVKET